MALEDRIRTSVDAHLVELTSRVNDDVRNLVQELLTAALEERTAEVKSAREETLRDAATETQRRVEEVEAQARVREREAEAQTRVREREAEAQATVREREAEMAAVTRLLDSIRALDSAASLSEVLDALAQTTARETGRAALLVVRGDRLIGWRLIGFGEHDTQPRSIDLGVTGAGVLSHAVAEARPVTTRQNGAHSPAFASLSSDRMGLAVPVSVGGRAVAVVYADSARHTANHQTPSAWPEVIEMLARHAARCLEALTVQKTVSAATPRFWMQAAARPGATA